MRGELSPAEMRSTQTERRVMSTRFVLTIVGVLAAALVVVVVGLAA
jgi:hypothetical protein